jgi:hypothetical protein
MRQVLPYAQGLAGFGYVVDTQDVGALGGCEKGGGQRARHAMRNVWRTARAPDKGFARRADQNRKTHRQQLGQAAK